MDPNKEELLNTQNEATEPTPQNEEQTAAPSEPTVQQTPEAPNFYGQMPPYMDNRGQYPYQTPPQYGNPSQYGQHPQYGQYPRYGSWQNGIPPMPPMPPVPTKPAGKGFSIASLVLGILGVTMSGSVFSFITSLLALIFGIIGRKRSKAVFGKANGLGTAGFILGIIGLSLTFIAFTCTCTADMLTLMLEDLGATEV